MRLTNREQEVYALLCQGKSNQAIADDLQISLKAVEKHLTSIYAKLGVTSRTQALLKRSQPSSSSAQC